jgi:2-amino-4-hydroxy-6-hydroxymethyldihydropteridine diphosphokinase
VAGRANRSHGGAALQLTSAAVPIQGGGRYIPFALIRSTANLSSPLAYLALGSNLGDRAGHLSFARRELGLLPGSRVIAASRVEETSPLGDRKQPPYLNQMLLLVTTLPPRSLLEACREIENAAGRVRRERWESRTLDIDIVRYGDLSVNEPDLTIPHPGLKDREFWQREIREIEQQQAIP